ncbi:MAG: hypothetical protein CMN87_14175 [Stappia sp.]|uniref:hypothetical protein n=1 Tax=Stappia sp. TaxID=1870903 RepID=UPI000C590EB6|nr:hypothetical protein [Stappia sp.]MAA96843.1 hypothetical protein [Stappia sp.]MBM21151.1 hypothetical protein [Stappia sp.]
MPRRLSFLTRSSRPGTRRGLLAAAAVGALALGGCQSGSDGFSDGSTNDEAPDVAMVRSLMEGLGAVDAKTDKKIEYTPRAPLAMPSKVDTLPPPEEREVVANWPEANDGDLKKIQDIYRNKNPDQLEDAGPSSPLQSRGIKQLASGGANRNISEEIRKENRLEDARLKPNELGQRVGVAKADTRVVDENGNPVRRYLIEPPTAYSKPSPDAPMRAPEKVEQDQPRISTTEQLMDGKSARTLR